MPFATLRQCHMSYESFYILYVEHHMFQYNWWDFISQQTWAQFQKIHLKTFIVWLYLHLVLNLIYLNSILIKFKHVEKKSMSAQTQIRKHYCVLKCKSTPLFIVFFCFAALWISRQSRISFFHTGFRCANAFKASNFIIHGTICNLLEGIWDVKCALKRQRHLHLFTIVKMCPIVP